MIHKLSVGIRRNPKKFFLAIAFGYSTLWAIMEPLFALLDIKATGYNWYFLASYLIVSIIISLFIIYPKKEVKFNLKNTNTTVEIVFGDLFKSKGHKVISVDEYFDSKIGKPVASKALQGIFIEKILGGHIAIFDNAVNQQLAGKEIETAHRIEGKNLKYEIGTTITIQHNQSLYFLFAMANSDYDCNASSSPSIMLNALDGLWKKVRIEGNGEDINIPLVGDGLSRVGLPPTQLLQLILISILKSAKERDLSSTIRVILVENVFDKIDLQSIKQNWE